MAKTDSRSKEMLGLLNDMLETLEDLMSYVPDYFKEKNKYEADLKRFKKRVEEFCESITNNQ